MSETCHHQYWTVSIFTTQRRKTYNGHCTDEDQRRRTLQTGINYRAATHS